MAKKFNDPSIATITVLNDADMMSTFDASTGELSKILVSDVKDSITPTFEETLQAQGATAFTTDNNIDFADKSLNFLASDGVNSSDLDFNSGGTFMDAYDAVGTGTFQLGVGNVLMQWNDADLTNGYNFHIAQGSQGYSRSESNVEVNQQNFSNAATGNFIIPLSVNNTVADSAGNIPLVGIADDFLNDAAAATGGIAVGELYHTSGVVKIRLS